MRLFEIYAAHITNKFDIHDIDNRRFMYNPKSRKFMLGDAIGSGKNKKSVEGSHAEEYYNIHQTNKGFDDCVRGWVGCSKIYKNGIIHFAPPIPPASPENWDWYDAGYKALQFFLKNGGATPETLVRGWENSFQEIKLGVICKL